MKLGILHKAHEGFDFVVVTKEDFILLWKTELMYEKGII